MVLKWLPLFYLKLYKELLIKQYDVSIIQYFIIFNFLFVKLFKFQLVDRYNAEEKEFFLCAFYLPPHNRLNFLARLLKYLLNIGHQIHQKL